jgi:hypothetical protein
MPTWFPSANVTPTSASGHYEDGSTPISDDGLAELERKAWRRIGPPSLTYTLRVVTLQRLIARVRAAERKPAVKGYPEANVSPTSSARTPTDSNEV